MHVYSLFLKVEMCLMVFVGFRLLFQDAKEVQKIKTRMITNSIDYQKLPYREMEKLRQVRYGPVIVQTV